MARGGRTRDRGGYSATKRIPTCPGLPSCSRRSCSPSCLRPSACSRTTCSPPRRRRGSTSRPSTRRLRSFIAPSRRSTAGPVPTKIPIPAARSADRRTMRGMTEQHTVGDRTAESAEAPPWVQVSYGAPARDRVPERTGKVLGWVSFAALLALIAVAIGGAFAARDLAEKQAVHDSVVTSQLLAESLIDPALDDNL